MFSLKYRRRELNITIWSAILNKAISQLSIDDAGEEKGDENQ
jgi:hypothetical protein